MQHHTVRIKEEQEEEGTFSSTASPPISPSLRPPITAQDEDYIAHLSYLFHHEPFPKVQSILETATHYHQSTLPLSTFTSLLTRITDTPLTRHFLLRHPIYFAPWVLTRIQQCLERMTELYSEDIDILVPLLSFETNKYGSTVLDRFLPVLERRILRNPSFAVAFVERVVEGVEKGEVSEQGKAQVLEGVQRALSLIFFKDDRGRVGEYEEDDGEEGDGRSRGGHSRPSTARSSITTTSISTSLNQSPPKARAPTTSPSPHRNHPYPLPLTLAPRAHSIPKLSGASLATFFTYYLSASQPDAVRSILWNMQLSLPAHSFTDFTRLHLPLLENLLPILPRYGIGYDDMVVEKYCYGVLYRVVTGREGTGMDTVPSSSLPSAEAREKGKRKASEREVLQTEMADIQRAFYRLDQSALQQILGERYNEFRRAADEISTADTRTALHEQPMPSVEHEQRITQPPMRAGASAAVASEAHELGSTGFSAIGSSSPPTPLPQPWLTRVVESAESSSARSDLGERTGGEGSASGSASGLLSASRRGQLGDG